jgi:hypothetical protein
MDAGESYAINDEYVRTCYDLSVPNTSIHFPTPLLEQLTRLATERGVTRNALVVESCRRLVEEHSSWPPGFFDDDRLTSAELAELRGGEQRFLDEIRKARKTRKAAPFS